MVIIPLRDPDLLRACCSAPPPASGTALAVIPGMLPSDHGSRSLAPFPPHTLVSFREGKVHTFV